MSKVKSLQVMDLNQELLHSTHAFYLMIQPDNQGSLSSL